jgi:hypothetical protein
MFGNVQILKIPLSGTLVKNWTCLSVNAIDARYCYWTDGKMDAPNFPVSAWLRHLSTTGELFWTDECEKIQESATEEKYRDVPNDAEPTLEHYRQALVSGVASTPEKQKYLLLRYW